MKVFRTFGIALLASLVCSSIAIAQEPFTAGTWTKTTSAPPSTVAHALLLNDGSVLVSQPFFRKFHLGLGDTINLATPTGRRDFKISGVYIDYTSEGGIILVDWQTYRRYWQDTSINGLALYLDKRAGLNAG